MKVFDRGEVITKTLDRSDDGMGDNVIRGLFNWVSDACEASDDGTIVIKIWYLGDFYVRFRRKKRTKAEYNKEIARDKQNGMAR